MPTFRIGHPPQVDLPVRESWECIKVLEHKQILCSIGIGVTAAIAMAIIWIYLYPESLSFGSPSWNEFFISTAVLTFGHEILHLFGLPKAGFGSSTTFGIWPKLCSPYVQHTVPMSRDRFILAAALPFLVLTIVPLLLAEYKAYIDYLSWISVLNSIGAGHDLLLCFVAVFNLPAKAQVLESDKFIYWKYN